jgi:hypothetical protein
MQKKVQVPSVYDQKVTIESETLDFETICRYQFQFSVNAIHNDKLDIFIEKAQNTEVYLMYGLELEGEKMKEVSLKT